MSSSDQDQETPGSPRREYCSRTDLREGEPRCDPCVGNAQGAKGQDTAREDDCGAHQPQRVRQVISGSLSTQLIPSQVSLTVWHGKCISGRAELGLCAGDGAGKEEGGRTEANDPCAVEGENGPNDADRGGGDGASQPEARLDKGAHGTVVVAPLDEGKGRQGDRDEGRRRE